MNIEFKHDPHLATQSVERVLSDCGYDYTVKELNGGYGKKYSLAIGGAIVLYFKKGLSSTLITEKINDADAGRLIHSIQLATGSQPTKILSNSPISVYKSSTSRIELDIPTYGNHIGTDESGKGDFFGGLSVAGVYIDSDSEEILRSAGVKDSKSLTDNKIIQLNALIYATLGAESIATICLTPTEYNINYPLYGSNVNIMLARAHTRIIEMLLSKHDCSNVVIDQFCEESTIFNALHTLGSKANILLTPRAERDIAVAAASIVARANFIEQMENLSQQCGFELPKGANAIVVDKAKQVKRQLGADRLSDFVKTHFKTIDKI